jgi:hypothetical protein
MGEHYIERWLSYDPITDFVPEQHAVHQRRAASRGKAARFHPAL